MATILEAVRNAKSFVDGFEKESIRIIQDHKPEITQYVKEQLFSGINGRGKNLRPTYDNDPFFKTEEAGRWKNNAKGYKNWKLKIQPPRASSFGFPARDINTPNLIIRGDFYDSITAINSDKGITIFSSGISFGKDIELKYSSVIFGISPLATEYFIKNIFLPELNNYISKFK